MALVKETKNPSCELRILLEGAAAKTIPHTFALYFSFPLSSGISLILTTTAKGTAYFICGFICGYKIYLW